MQKVLEELKKESKLKISWENVIEVTVARPEEIKTKMHTSWRILKQNNIQQFDQVIEEAWKKRRKKMVNANWWLQKKKYLEKLQAEKRKVITSSFKTRLKKSQDISLMLEKIVQEEQEEQERLTEDKEARRAELLQENISRQKQRKKNKWKSDHQEKIKEKRRLGKVKEKRKGVTKEAFGQKY